MTRVRLIMACSRETLLRTAEEMFVVCPDVVHQGAGTIDRLAAHLGASTLWTLWWD